MFFKSAFKYTNVGRIFYLWGKIINNYIPKGGGLIYKGVVIKSKSVLRSSQSVSLAGLISVSCKERGYIYFTGSEEI